MLSLLIQNITMITSFMAFFTWIFTWIPTEMVNSHVYWTRNMGPEYYMGLSIFLFMSFQVTWILYTIQKVKIFRGAKWSLFGVLTQFRVGFGHSMLGGLHYPFSLHKLYRSDFLGSDYIISMLCDTNMQNTVSDLHCVSNCFTYKNSWLDIF